MSSAQQGSNEIGRARANKSDKTRCSWTCREEETLLSSLKKLVAQGWKSDNEFRAGYFNKLEDVMKKVFPGTNLKGVLHINSKICEWKKNYYCLSAMLSRSGVDFNVNKDHMIDCANEQWDQIVKCDANVRLMHYKSWPLLDDWKEVFGKNRATGEHAEDLMDAVNDMYRHDNLAHGTAEGEYHVNLDDVLENEGVEGSVCQSQKGVVAVRWPSRKRKAGDEMGGVYELIGEISRNTDRRLENLANRIGYEFDLGKARNEVFEQLSQIPGMSLADKFDVC